MGVFDKLKNFFYEEEPVDETEEHEETLAKKVEVPKYSKTEKENHSRFDETQEIKFTNELPKFDEDEEKIQPVIEKEVKIEIKKEPEEERFNNFTGLFNDEDFEDQPEPELYDENKHITYETEKKETYQPKKEESYYQPPKKTYKSNYSFDSNKRFIPSPIISPIYGILDTNYSKDDVKIQRVESYVAKSDIDTVRNKAYGYKEETTYTTNDEENNTVDVKETVEVKVEVENHEEEPEENHEEEYSREETNSKPTVKKVTLEDADEYYNDLGLAYNEDYNDGQREEYQSRHNRHETKKDSENDNLFNLIDKMYNKED